MASTTTSTPLSLPSSFIDASTKAGAPPRHQSLPAFPPNTRLANTTAYSRKIARNVTAMATSTGEAPTEVINTTPAAPTETPEIVQSIQAYWDKLDDKYAVSSLVVAGIVALTASSGVISAVDKLPLIPGVLELVGIGYTGWFAYKNLVYQPDREALIEKVKCTYKDIMGTS